MRKSGDVSSKSKAIAALEAVKIHESLESIARRYKVHPIQVEKWRKRLLGDRHRIFEHAPSADAAAHEREVQELYEQIGHPNLENDFLRKKPALSS